VVSELFFISPEKFVMSPSQGVRMTILPLFPVSSLVYQTNSVQ